MMRTSFAVIIVVFRLLLWSSQSTFSRTHRSDENISLSPQMHVWSARSSRSLLTRTHDHHDTLSRGQGTISPLPHPHLSSSSPNIIKSNHAQSGIKDALQLALEEVFGQLNKPVKSDRAQSSHPVKSDPSILPSQSRVRWRCHGALACEYITPTLVIHDAVLHQVT